MRVMGINPTMYNCNVVVFITEPVILWEVYYDKNSTLLRHLGVCSRKCNCMCVQLCVYGYGMCRKLLEYVTKFTRFHQWYFHSWGHPAPTLVSQLGQVVSKCAN